MMTIKTNDVTKNGIEYPAFIFCEDCDQWECIQCRTETCEGCPSPIHFDEVNWLTAPLPSE